MTAVQTSPRAKRGEARHWLEEVMTESTSDCQIYPFKASKGRAIVQLEDGRRVYVQVHVLEKFSGPRPHAHIVGTTCDQPLCANRLHLQWVPRSPSAGDRVTRARPRVPEKAEPLPPQLGPVLAQREALRASRLSRRDQVEVRRQAARGMSVAELMEEWETSRFEILRAIK